MIGICTFSPLLKSSGGKNSGKRAISGAFYPLGQGLKISGNDEVKYLVTMGIQAIKTASTKPRPTNPQNPSLVRSSSLSILPSSLASDVLICPLTSLISPLMSENPTRISKVRSAIALVLASIAVLISLISVSIAWVIYSDK
jgi:hypothetical protein